MRDARWLWLLLVPRLPERRELTDLDAAQQAQLMREIDLSSRLLLKVAKPTKLNTAALGNIVEQLHVHVVARHVGDAAWPGPIWGVGQAEARDDAYWMNERQVLLEALAGLDDPSDVAISVS
jgi:diadenosine tetraphosphate (Ap4A) HIT family hydrolase